MNIFNNRTGEIWSKDYTSKSIWGTVVLLLLLNLLFLNYYTPIGLIILIIGVSAFFFLSLRKYIVEWMELPYEIFIKKIFYRSLLIRFVFFLVMILYTLIYSPDSLAMLEMFPADAWNYDAWGITISENLLNGRLLFTLETLFRESADWGFPFYLGVINFLFSHSVFLFKLFNIFWGSLTVVYVSKIAFMLYSEKHAKLTAIIMMIMPSIIWFNLHLLKETVMIFIIVIIFYNAIIIIKKGFSFKNILFVILFTISLYYFRTALATVVILSLAVYFTINIIYDKRNKFLNILVLLLFVTFVLYLSQTTEQLDSVETGYNTLQKEEGLESIIIDKVDKLGDKLNFKISLAVPLVLLSAFITPYPTFLNMDYRQITIINHSQNEITRIIIFYFALAAIPFLLKRDLKNSSLLLSFVISYVVILALTANSYEDRYQLPALPFMIVFISVGMLNLSDRVHKNWNKYLLIVYIAIFLWHLFKLSIRGAV